MAAPIYATISSVGTTVYALDHYTNPFNCAIQFVVPAGVTVSATLNWTLDPIDFVPAPGYGASSTPTPTWTAFATPTQPMTTTQTIDLTSPTRALQLVVSSLSGGDVYLKIVQPFSIN